MAKAKLDLKALWSQDDKALKQEKIDDALSMLKINADSYIATLKKEAVEKEKAVKGAMKNALDTENFDAIVKAKMDFDAHAAKFEFAVETYEELFEVAPTITKLK